MSFLFGTKELCSCLISLGFTPKKQKATRHQKYVAPKHIKIESGIRPFIIVILGKKKYDPHTCSSYITQIKQKGFLEETILSGFSK